MTAPPISGKILIADDNPENIRVLMEALEEDCQVVVAKDGEKALEKALRYLPDLILLDIMMPGLDGFEVCRRLKNNKLTKNIPIIFVTAMSDAAAEEKGLKLGAIDYIRKPFHLPVAQVRISNHLKLKRKTDLLEELVRIDGLTDIHNRRAFDERLSQEWKRARRSAEELSLIMLDVDFFKKYNDNYGHAPGDNCLVKVARKIKQCVKRPSDFVARYGGEEFAVLLPKTPREPATILAENIRAEIEKLALAHQYSPVASCVTISGGLSTMAPNQDMTATSLVKQADAALYQAKESGRNRLHFFQETSAAL